MPFPKGLIKKPRTIEGHVDAMEAALCMQRWNVGSLIVLEHGCPVGVVTDRDIALAVIVGELDPAACPVADCMNAEVISISTDSGTTEAIELMRRNGIRRLPVVDGAGKLCGIVAADDLVQSMARELSDLAAVIRSEMSRQDTAASAGSTVFGKE